MSAAASQGRVQQPDDVLAHVPPGAHVIVPMAHGEPVALLDALETHHERLDDVRVHQMHALHERPYLHGRLAPQLRHVSYFLSPVAVAVRRRGRRHDQRAARASPP